MGARSTASEIFHRWLVLYVPVATLLLGLSTVVGFLLGSAIPVESLPTVSDGGSNPFFPDELTTVSIAINNLIAMTVLLLGAVSLGILTVFGLVVNGLVIGVVVGIALQTVSPVVILALIVPHGILEIPALLIVSAIGLRFGRLTIRYLRGTEDELLTERDLREAGVLVVVATVLIILAAYIEATLTLTVAERFADVPPIPTGT